MWLQTFMGTPMAAKTAPQRSAVRAMPAVKATAVKTVTRTPVPLELEKGDMPMNTFNNKAPFIAKIKSVERIVGPKATGETCHIIIETDGKIPFWEGQSYGVIPPVSHMSNYMPCYIFPLSVWYTSIMCVLEAQDYNAA